MKAGEKRKCKDCPSRVNYEKRGSKYLSEAHYDKDGHIVWAYCVHGVMVVDVADYSNSILPEVPLEVIDFQIAV